MQLSVGCYCETSIGSLPEQRSIVRADCAVDIVGQELIHSMPADTGCKAQDLVGDGAQFETDAALLHELHHVWVLCEREAMPDTLRLEKQGIDQVAVCIRSHIQGLTAMKQERDFYFSSLAVLLELEELGDKVLDGPSLGLFADKIETYYIVSTLDSRNGRHVPVFSYLRSTPARPS